MENIPVNQKSKISLFIIIGLALVSSGFFLRILSLDYVDQRFHILTAETFSANQIVISVLAMFAILALEYSFLCKQSIPDAEKKMFFSNWPLLFWLAGWFFPLHYSILPLYILCGALAAARWCGNFDRLPPISWKQCFWSIGIIAAADGIAGGLWQVWSYNHLGMQWFDWGHFYEILVNTANGRFFYLDLVQGNFLGSRFCISLLVLMPVALLRSPELFLITGAVLIASGAAVVAWNAKVLKLEPLTALGCGLTFLLLPGSVNMMLAQLDGFHEVFLLFPVVFGAWGCYRSGRKKWAAVLWIFSLGIRETVGVMWVMWGIVLMCRRETRRDGAILAAVSAVWTILLIMVLMPWLSALSNGYEHTVFFPHLGSSVGEILMSPFTRPAAFWGTLFSLHNLDFGLGLLLPFIFALLVSPKYLLIMLPDLVMVMLDYRFDSQNLLRHYQSVPLIILTITFVEALAELKNAPDRKIAVFLKKVLGENPVNSVLGYTMAAGILSCCCFAQIPYFPASDPRLVTWSDARPAVAEFYELIPPGVPVTAGPGMACYFAGRNELNVYRHDSGREVFDYVVIESFMAVYGENALRVELLRSGEWEVRHTVCLDDRLLQLLVRKKDGAPEMIRPESVFMIDDTAWENWGVPVPNQNPQVDIRGRVVGDHLLIAVRVKETLEYDLGLNVELSFADRQPISFFRCFGDGIYPACLARIGEMWIMAMPLEAPPVKCVVSQTILPVKASEHIYK